MRHAARLHHAHRLALFVRWYKLHLFHTLGHFIEVNLNGREVNKGERFHVGRYNKSSQRRGLAATCGGGFHAMGSFPLRYRVWFSKPRRNPESQNIMTVNSILTIAGLDASSMSRPTIPLP